MVNIAGTIHEVIAAAGIPLDGVATQGAEIELRFRPEATPAQRAQARQIADTTDWTQPQTRAAKLEARIDQGFLVTPEGFRLKISEEDQKLLDRLANHLSRKKSLGKGNNNDPVTLIDVTGVPRQVARERYFEIADAYGDYALHLWAAQAGLGPIPQG